jgi:ferrous iron transport protein A
VFGGRDPLALTIGRMTVALRRSHAKAMQVEELA